MSERSIPAMSAPPVAKDNPLTRSTAGLIGLGVLTLLIVLCVGSLPYALSASEQGRPARYEDGSLQAILLPPTWTGYTRGAVDVAEALAADPDLDVRRLDAAGAGVSVSLERYARYTLERAEAEERARLENELGVAEGEGLPDGVVVRPTREELEAAAPTIWLGTDKLGRSLLVRSLAGGGVSIGIGLAAALISVTIGTVYGATAGYLGGRADAAMMRVVDILYGLPYILLVVLLAVAGDALIDRVEIAVAERAMTARAAWQVERALELSDASARRAAVEVVAPAEGDAGEGAAEGDGAAQLRRDAEAALVDGSMPVRRFVRRGVELTGSSAFAEPVILSLVGGDEEARRAVQSEALRQEGLPNGKVPQGLLRFFDVAVLFVAIGGVSWLTMARVIRGQVLSLKAQPFMEAARAMGVPVRRQFVAHLLPNLLGPIIVYATLTVPQAILQESFLSFLGIGVKAPLPSWGNLAADGLTELNTITPRWWLLVFPCLLLGVTLLALNFVGEGLREAFDPKRARK